MPYLRQTSALVGAVSPSRRIWMICSSLNRRFIPRSFTSERSRLTIHLVQFVGSRAYGLSWQVVSKVLYEMLQNPHPKRATRVTEALYQMTKIDIAKLQQAYEQA